MRLYLDVERDDPVLGQICDVVCTNDNIDVCDAKNLPGNPVKDARKVFAMNWRFFPTLDPQVNLNMDSFFFQT